MRDKPRWEIIHGDSLTVLESFPPSTFDAVITDPPYASGGRTQAEKSKATAKKYSSMGGNAPPDFDGDAKDQRSWTRWAAEWLYLARRAAKPGAPVCMFIDWRQLPCASDALQWAGWIWRGIAVWDKGNSRPQKGRFRQQAEYIVWGSNGDMPVSRPVPCLPGVFKYGNPQNRIHLTEKPLQLMQDLVKITEPGGHILDCRLGSGHAARCRCTGKIPTRKRNRAFVHKQEVIPHQRRKQRSRRAGRSHDALWRRGGGQAGRFCGKECRGDAAGVGAQS